MMKGTAQVDVEDAVPLGEGHLQRRGDAFQRGVVDQDLQPAQRLNSAFHQVLRAFLLADIALQRRGRPGAVLQR